MKATEILEDDHTEAIDMIERLNAEEERSLPANGLLFTKLKRALQWHTTLEENYLYPALANFNQTIELVKASFENNERIDQLLAHMRPGTEDWEHQLSELRRYLEHHVSEEENEIFPEAETLLGERKLEEIGRKMAETKHGGAFTAYAARER